MMEGAGYMSESRLKRPVSTPVGVSGERWPLAPARLAYGSEVEARLAPDAGPVGLPGARGTEVYAGPEPCAAALLGESDIVF